jgi:hypothetical protein
MQAHGPRTIWTATMKPLQNNPEVFLIENGAFGCPLDIPFI